MIKRGVVLGSPDHVLDTFEKQPLVATSIRFLALDCFDDMIENYHSNELKGILRCRSRKIRLLMISRTDVSGVAEMLDFIGLSDALVIRAYRNPVSVMEGIRHFFVREQKEKPKYHVLLDMLRAFNVPKVIVFRNSNSQVTNLRKKMQASNFEVLEIKGNTLAEERHRRMEELSFKKFLITTDAFASELVDEEVSLVINYDLPVHARQYLHRTGWHGRFSSYVIDFLFSLSCYPVLLIL
ncbi:eukaryotic initiation factor 4A-3-like [Primulina huaijiensis]|uniref:eukaryotic initiation factor 4A-3-like n=1 Tax=Primulina huaijiensis TaxID=1492673 RepID=UPI003CC742D0